MEKPEIKYPCEWCYTVIGADETLMRNAVSETFCGKAHSLALSKKSKEGKYISLIATTDVKDEKERLELYKLLAKNPAIKIVL